MKKKKMISYRRGKRIEADNKSETRTLALALVKHKGVCTRGPCRACPSEVDRDKGELCVPSTAYRTAVDWLINNGYKNSLLEELI